MTTIEGVRQFADSYDCFLETGTGAEASTSVGDGELSVASLPGTYTVVAAGVKIEYPYGTPYVGNDYTGVQH